MKPVKQVPTYCDLLQELADELKFEVTYVDLPEPTCAGKLTNSMFSMLCILFMLLYDGVPSSFLLSDLEDNNITGTV